MLAEVVTLDRPSHVLAAMLRSYAEKADRGEIVCGALVVIAADGSADTVWCDAETLGRNNQLLGGIAGLQHRVACDCFGAGVERYRPGPA